MEQRTDFRSMIENLKRKYAESPVPEDGTAAIIAPVSITLEELRLSRFPGETGCSVAALRGMIWVPTMGGS